jgi:hypothetical protein
MRVISLRLAVSDSFLRRFENQLLFAAERHTGYVLFVIIARHWQIADVSAVG